LLFTNVDLEVTPFFGLAVQILIPTSQSGSPAASLLAYL